jgi:conjugative relaxase-like TrwC/TraI family protein
VLRINQQRSSRGAKSYFDEALAQNDYYTQASIPGRWGGQGAGQLGLGGEIQRDDFLSLCDNLNPRTGKNLTARTRDGRTVGYDFTFNCPKSLSLLYALTRDERLLGVFQNAVAATMKQLEAEVQTRVRRGGQNTERTTGNLLYGEFVHFTSRPVDGKPDPHLHAHCFVFNATFDTVEANWKAGHFQNVVRDAPFWEACFHARLSRSLAEMGLAIERTKNGWELAGMNDELLTKFSRRTSEIERRAREQGITDAAEKAKLGAKTRDRKGAEQTLETLQAEWKARLSEAERRSVFAVLNRQVESHQPPVNAPAAVGHAVLHGFERESVTRERKLLTNALKRGYGAVTIEGVQRAYEARTDILKRQDGSQTWVTTEEVLKEEAAILKFARETRGTCLPLRTKCSGFCKLIPA